MKSLFAFASVPVLTFLLCSCSSFEPTRNLEEALAHVEDDIEYHDRAYMEERPIYVPVIADMESLNTLKFVFAFEQSRQDSEIDTNTLTADEWSIFRKDFENAIAGSRRFPVAQIRQGLADSQLRREQRNGLNNASELDVSEMIEAEGIIHIVPTLSMSESLVKREKTVTSTFKLDCSPLAAKNNAPLESFPSFSVSVQSKIYQLTDRFGRPTRGFRFTDASSLEDYHLRQGRAAIVRFFSKMYSMFPVGGAIVSIEDDTAVFKSSRAVGLQPNMECVIFAKKKDNPDAALVPLYNATAISVGQTGNSTLQIWRESDKKSAKAIIKRIKEDFDEAREDYDFYACSDGFAQWPDFVDHQNQERD